MGHKTKSPSKSHVASKSLGAPKVNDENAPSKANKKSKSAPKLLKDAVKADSSDSSDSDSDSSSSSSSDSDSSSSSSSSSSSDSSDSESEAETKKSSENAAAAKKTPAPAESDSDSSSSSDSDSSSDEEEAPAKSKKTPAPLPTEDAGSESDDESSDSSDSDSSDSDDDKKKAKKEGKSVLGKRSSSSDSDSSSSSSSDSSDSDSSDSDDEPRTKKSKSSHTPSEDVPEVEVDVKPTPVENREPIVESQADAFQNARKRGREWSGENQGGDFGNKRPREGRADTDAVSVFMGRLPREGVEEHDIQGWFEEADLSVVQVRMIRDRETREFKGACFVQFNDEESMKKACAFDGERFFGRPVRINAASKRPGEGGAGGAGGAPGGRPQRGPPGTVLFVGNIPWSAGENELRSHFGDAGVTNIHMPLNDWGKPKGFALVSFPDTESCSAAEKKFAGSMLADRELRIEVSGGGGGGGGGGDRRGSFGGGDRRGGFGGGDRRGGFGGGDRAPRGGLGFGKSQPKAFQGEKKTFAGSDSD